MDPDEVGPSDDPLIIMDEQSQMPEAVQKVIETPSSLANDSQLHQLLSNMHNQLKDMEGQDSDEDEDVIPGGTSTIDEELTLAKEIADTNKAILKDDAHRKELVNAI
mmetsp:Transcript_45564/g.60458  ORF Transcript_45564/g.60458 Transcript_45564/m.60458 type:complete len:107 (-) Transcript_45564:112-432(-)|eukprot:CAMPEP_0185598456 /NCGR_PEP_ID=MMETSP0434-20130131/82008_1 /TAXON_ID=626734 ORGANISM="Favella taraikaensis, Strain Fe Narragansett Bay" /NCGR_SAMPLE_ID=MMETSP0434 /ASSEMBLY_ACC=CAM_ASM_000379 /LENGTH=106 /DNA_ID=CAMNT_0028227443 /DNA_START=3518 /DNA_END=3838 /DNA_ORIENTATION=-